MYELKSPQIGSSLARLFRLLGLAFLVFFFFFRCSSEEDSSELVLSSVIGSGRFFLFLMVPYLVPMMH